MTATSAASAVILGRAGDRKGYRPVLLFSAAATAVLFIPQFFVTNPWQLLILQAAVGFTLGGVIASMGGLSADVGRLVGVSLFDRQNAMERLQAVQFVDVFRHGGIDTRRFFGHTAYTMAVNLAVEWKVKTLVLFHHEPRSDDRKIHGMARRARFHLGQLGAGPLTIHTAQEGMELTV